MEAAPLGFTNAGQCEAIFRDNFTRDDSGRFAVPLPFRFPVHDHLFPGSRAVITVLPQYCAYQHILWRSSPHKELIEYELNIVTYGVNCSPFLALRILQEVADVDCRNFTRVCDALRYQTAGFELRKWASNTEEILKTVSDEFRVVKSTTFVGNEDIETKVLGLSWHTLEATTVVVNPTATHQQCSPNVAKFVAELPALASVRVPRYFNTAVGAWCSLYGFCDASQRGYAAIVFLRVHDAPREPSIMLVGAKTKSAPLKSLIVPRLELKAAILLLRWLSRIRSLLQKHIVIVD
ncbi:hypothetical protein AGLY_017271 [Aphis glycines]|uniref:Uncharacterized protein n=1 Tax=Aphis glycines TaxID=307491 RepID=A0A6G0SW56_APHGL|nr:hypothetical protein AGLY_017271 [Aphis glycines]